MHRLIRTLAFATLLPLAAAAQQFPNKVVRLMVPFPPGGATDIIGRLVSAKMQDVWGQPVVVENKPGAANNLGTDFVAKSPPDGYTLVIVASSHATNKWLYKDLPYDPVKDFAPVVYTHVVPLLLAVHPSVPAKNVQELTAWVRVCNPHFVFRGSQAAFLQDLADDVRGGRLPMLSPGRNLPLCQ